MNNAWFNPAITERKQTKLNIHRQWMEASFKIHVNVLMTLKKWNNIILFSGDTPDKLGIREASVQTYIGVF